MEKVKRSPEAHIRSLPAEVRDDVAQLHRLISSTMKGTSCALWEGTFWGGSAQQIIGYGDNEYPRSDGNTVRWFMVGLALQKNYISVYVNAVDGRQYLSEKYKTRLGKVKVGKSSISFKHIDDVNLDALKELLEKARAQMPSSS